MKVMVCQWCGDRLETVTDEPGVYVHEKDGYSICWSAPNDEHGNGRNAEPTDPSSWGVMTTAICARCNQRLHPGDQVVDVRQVTRVYDDGTIATDRVDGDGTAHLDCKVADPLEYRHEDACRCGVVGSASLPCNVDT